MIQGLTVVLGPCPEIPLTEQGKGLSGKRKGCFLSLSSPPGAGPIGRASSSPVHHAFRIITIQWGPWGPTERTW